MTVDTKTVLITGSNRGIGLAFARHYVANGWKVIAAARDVDGATDLKELAVSRVVSLDVADENSIAKAAEQLEGEPIDLLVNNAGMSHGADLLGVAKADLMKLFEVNAVGPFLVTKAFLPNLKLAVAKRGSATVAQISSQRGSIAQNDTGGKYGYRTSKAALNMLNTSLAIDLRSDKITTLALHPGYVVTRMTGHKGEVTPDESVAGLTKVITNAKPVDSGKYLDFLGNSLPW
ncbi:putative short chain dehydrogenase [Phytophthora cinnamomi]|uniref:putative short chain dehydrogenase n=1 Tax=Phytophthora cinnamomi TaxID=4785 RepID=UPI003559F8AA|nr:putative short chain dehydrogenase [Phytophthora cinnamomi]